MEQGLEDPLTDFIDAFHPTVKMNFLQTVRAVAHKAGALFILDEIVTGFRYSLGGAAALYDVDPDLVCIGKAMANGFSIAAICGKREYMETLNDGVFFSFTFAGETTSIAAAIATIKILQRERVVQDIWKKGEILRGGLQAAAEMAKLPINLRVILRDRYLKSPAPMERTTFSNTASSCRKCTMGDTGRCAVVPVLETHA